MWVWVCVGGCACVCASEYIVILAFVQDNVNFRKYWKESSQYYLIIVFIIYKF